MQKNDTLKKEIVIILSRLDDSYKRDPVSEILKNVLCSLTLKSIPLTTAFITIAKVLITPF